jgi:tetratricopeptide (TPR) repeat protein
MRTAAADRRSRIRVGLAAVALAGAAFVTFAPAIGYQFVSFDDPFYITQTPQVTQGLSVANAAWAFATSRDGNWQLNFRNGNWHPLTWLSLQLDATLWGPGPRGFHLTNVLLHSANAALVFLVLHALTRAFWPAVAAAALFAVHPLRAESVAWISERKDVLSIFFGLLALLAYAGYARQRSVRLYLVVLVAFTLSLLAKPTLVTLPCLLLVLDWWPLRRVPAEQPAPKSGEPSMSGPRKAAKAEIPEKLTVPIGPPGSAVRDWLRLVAEKVPLVAVLVGSCVVTFLAQGSRGAVKPFTLQARAENSAVAYVAYLNKTVWPAGLAVYYPHPNYPGGQPLSSGETAGAVVVLVLLTAAGVALRKRAPYLLTGWLWYLGTLVPVIGLVQVGTQAYADRYTYFPQIGLLVALCWGVADLFRSRPRLALSAGAAATLALVAVTQANLPVWKDSFSLWENARLTTGENATTLVNLGQALEDRKNWPKAEQCYRSAIEIESESVAAHNDLGRLYISQSRFEEAIRELKEACELAPNFPLVRNNLGNAYYLQKKPDEAAVEFAKAIELAPEYDQPYRALGKIELDRKNADHAAELFRQAVRLSPGSADGYVGLGIALGQKGQHDDALELFKTAARVDPNSANAFYNLGKVLYARGELNKADDCFRRVLDLKPPPQYLQDALRYRELIRNGGKPQGTK